MLQPRCPSDGATGGGPGRRKWLLFPSWDLVICASVSAPYVKAPVACLLRAGCFFSVEEQIRADDAGASMSRIHLQNLIRLLCGARGGRAGLEAIYLEIP